MFFLTQLPCLGLQAQVDWYWFYEGLTPTHQLERVLPDGTFELVINLRSESRHVFARENLTPIAAYRRAWLSGAQQRHLVIDTAPDSSMIGVHFKPGGAAALLGLPATEFAGRVVELDLFWGARGSELRDRLLEVRAPTAKFRRLEQFLLECGQRSMSMSRHRRPSSPGLAIAQIVRQLTADPQASSIATLAGQAGVSHKHLIERFRDVVGLSPKRFCRIRRFRSVLQAIESGGRIEWADIAAACGYYDQPHFINDFYEFSGLNPSDYLVQRGEYIGHVPVPGKG
jgi:AraC-like DNA-binding protein